MKINLIRHMLPFSFVLLWNISFGSSVDTITINSQSLGKASKVVVILPDAYQQDLNKEFPVVYLLHGYGGRYSNWLGRVPALKRYADKYQFILVFPDGENSWYVDSKNVKGSNYESYVGVELPQFIDGHYRTFRDKNLTAITGLSMGGHGAIFLALRHRDVFGAAGSMSGVMDLAALRSFMNLKTIIGDTSLTSAQAYSDIHIVNASDSTLSITIDCGVDDDLIGMNREMHQRLMELHIPHDYTERPGRHTWNYWANSVEYHLLFFRKYFQKSEVFRSE